MTHGWKETPPKPRPSVPRKRDSGDMPLWYYVTAFVLCFLIPPIGIGMVLWAMLKEWDSSCQERDDRLADDIVRRLRKDHQ